MYNHFSTISHSSFSFLCVTMASSAFLLLCLLALCHGKPTSPNDISFKCALCGIALNELEGLLSENLTIAEIEATLDKDLCQPLGTPGSEVCDFLVGELGNIIPLITNPSSVSTICIDFGLCANPFVNHKDLVTVPHVTLNLDLPPSQRWTEICALPSVKLNGQFLYKFITELLPGHGQYLNDLGEKINDYYFPSEYRDEVKSCASAMGIPYGWLALFQLGYEVSDACTSIISQAEDGTIWHARNLDFGAGMGFTSTLKNATLQVDFQKGGKTVFTATTFGGYLGVLSGMKPNGFSGTVDTRFYPDGWTEIFSEVIAAIEERNATLVSFLLRDVLTQEADYAGALNRLSTADLIADVYYIIGGLKGEGAVVSRNRTVAADVWSLDAKAGRWFEVETNYDHWQSPPWFDNRRTPAMQHMNALGRPNIDAQNLLDILGMKPTLNLQTTYSIVACPTTGFYETFVRWCEYPCVQ
jgi:hypothetical protein